MNNTSTPMGGKPMSEEEIKAFRELQEKPFAELTPEQKIDRLVEVIRGLRYNTTRVYELEQKILKLENHIHADGKVVIPISHNNYSLNTGAALAGRDPLN